MAVFYDKVADKWEPIGIYLHLPMATLKVIAAEHHTNPHVSYGDAGGVAEESRPSPYLVFHH